MAAAKKDVSWPGAATSIGAVAVGIVAGAIGSLITAEVAAAPDTRLVPGTLTWPSPEGGVVPDRMTVGLGINNNGDADFELAELVVPGWNPAEPDAVTTTTIRAGEWAYVALDVVADCITDGAYQNVELVSADGDRVELDSDVGGLASLRQRACLLSDGPALAALPAVEAVRFSTEPAVLHVDIDVAHPLEAELDLALAAVTGRASGFLVDLPNRLTDLEAGTTTTVRTDWRVRDCGGAAGTTGTGAPDPSISGNFDGLTLHLYWDDPDRPEEGQPIRTDLAVELPPDTIVELARFAVTECGA
jgi:hypothetical protein